MHFAALDRHFPGLKERYIREYGNAYILSSPNAGNLTRLFRETCIRHNILYRAEDCFAYLNTLPESAPRQMSLF